MRGKINKTLIKALGPRDTVYDVVDEELPGFYLRVQPSGAKSYYVRYRLRDGTRRRMRIASEKHLTPTQARDDARKILADAVRGIDTIAAKQKRKGKHTLGRFLEEEYAPHCRQHLKRGEETMARLRLHVHLQRNWDIPGHLLR